MRTVAKVPERDESLDSIDLQHDRREVWAAVIITAIAFGVMLIASVLIVLSEARG